MVFVPTPEEMCKRMSLECVRKVPFYGNVGKVCDLLSSSLFPSPNEYPSTILLDPGLGFRQIRSTGTRQLTSCVHFPIISDINPFSKSSGWSNVSKSLTRCFMVCDYEVCRSFFN